MGTFHRSEIDTEITTVANDAEAGTNVGKVIAASSSPLEAFHKRAGTITIHDVEAKHGNFRMGDAGNLFPLLGTDPATLFLHNDESLFKGDDSQEIPEAGGWVAPTGESSGALDGQAACELANGKVVLTDLERWSRVVTKGEFERLWLYSDKNGYYNGEKSDANGRPLVWEIRCTPIASQDVSPATWRMNLAYTGSWPQEGEPYGLLKDAWRFNPDSMEWESLGDVPIGEPYACEGMMACVARDYSQIAPDSFGPMGQNGIEIPLEFRPLPGVAGDGLTMGISTEVDAGYSSWSMNTPLKTLCISESGGALFSKAILCYCAGGATGGVVRGWLVENVTAEEMAEDIININLPYPQLFEEPAVVTIERVSGESTLTLDWGDGSDLEDVSEGGTFSREYSSPGGYRIQLKKGEAVSLEHVVFAIQRTITKTVIPDIANGQKNVWILKYRGYGYGQWVPEIETYGHCWLDAPSLYLSTGEFEDVVTGEPVPAPASAGDWQIVDTNTYGFLSEGGVYSFAKEYVIDFTPISIAPGDPNYSMELFFHFVDSTYSRMLVDAGTVPGVYNVDPVEPPYPKPESMPDVELLISDSSSCHVNVWIVSGTNYNNSCRPGTAAYSWSKVWIVYVACWNPYAWNPETGTYGRYEYRADHYRSESGGTDGWVSPSSPAPNPSDGLIVVYNFTREAAIAVGFPPEWPGLAYPHASSFDRVGRYLSSVTVEYGDSGVTATVAWVGSIDPAAGGHWEITPNKPNYHNTYVPDPPEPAWSGMP